MAHNLDAARLSERARLLDPGLVTKEEEMEKQSKTSTEDAESFRTIKEALWARHGRDFGKLLDEIYRRANAKTKKRARDRRTR